MERPGRAPQISGRLWIALDGFRKLLSRFWIIMGMSGKLWKGSGWAVAKLWTALDGVLEAALERILTVLDGFRRFWTAWKLWIAAWSLLAVCRMTKTGSSTIWP